jgi:hypothetical protein
MLWLHTMSPVLIEITNIFIWIGEVLSNQIWQNLRSINMFPVIVEYFAYIILNARTIMCFLVVLGSL